MKATRSQFGEEDQLLVKKWIVNVVGLALIISGCIVMVLGVSHGGSLGTTGMLVGLFQFIGGVALLP